MADLVPHPDKANCWLHPDGSEYWGRPGMTLEEVEADLASPAAQLGLDPIIAIRAERDRRLAAGFDYDFGDERGVHRIATTPEDMIGWDAVTKWATARLVASVGPETLPIYTDTGPASVTAAEWMAIIAAATDMQQPIWQASIALEAMDPTPPDVTADELWDVP